MCTEVTRISSLAGGLEAVYRILEAVYRSGEEPQSAIIRLFES